MWKQRASKVGWRRRRQRLRLRQRVWRELVGGGGEKKSKLHIFIMQKGTQMKGKCFCFSTRLLVPCMCRPLSHSLPHLSRAVCLPECVCATFYASVCVRAHSKVRIVNGSHKELPSDWLEQARAAFVTVRASASGRGVRGAEGVLETP